jgi:hypothetical protein
MYWHPVIHFNTIDLSNATKCIRVLGWAVYSVDRATALVYRTSEEFRAMLPPPQLA